MKQDFPPTLPVFPLSGVILLPRGRLPLNIFEPRYLAMVEEAFAAKRMIGMVQPTGETGPYAMPKLYEVGCMGRIHSFSETDDGRYLISLCGVSRFRIIEELEMYKGFRRVTYDLSAFQADQDVPPPCAVDRASLIQNIRMYFDVRGIGGQLDLVEKSSDEKLITSLAMICPFNPCEKQALLEAPNLEERCKLLTMLMSMATLERDQDCQPLRH